ncbi:MAG: 3-oxoacyl-ACP reductase FabG [Candidatus Nitrospinota bacterium M3_3B_026]
MRDFEGQTAVVTGGTKGIGLAVCELFLREGAKVVAVYSSDEDAASSFAKAHAASGDALRTRRLNVSDHAAVEDFFREFQDAGGALDILVNSAGIRRDSVVGLMAEKDWRAVINVNLTGTFNMSKHAVRLMSRRRYGRIINITSPVGERGLPGQANYAASKAGQVGFTKAMAKEVASRGVTVNCVSPGFIDTEFIADLPEKNRKDYLERVPAGRFGTAEEVARLVGFLAARESSYITGAVYEVTGGL